MSRRGMRSRGHRCQPRTGGPSAGEAALAGVGGRIGPTMGRPGNLLGPDDRGGGDHVEHICPECGGDLAAYHGALIVVQTCWACAGRGRLTDAEMSSYMRDPRRNQ